MKMGLGGGSFFISARDIKNSALAVTRPVSRFEKVFTFRKIFDCFVSITNFSQVL